MSSLNNHQTHNRFVGSQAVKSRCRHILVAKKNPEPSGPGFLRLAERTGLEPATPGVTGRYSNQLNYRSKVLVGAEGIEPPTLAL